MALVSVILPNFNHARFLEQRINSILAQTYSEFEVILLDDKSSDESVEILESYASHEKVKHLLANTENSGSTFIQWKRGLELARGKYIWIAESDDFADPEFLENLVKILEDDPEIALVYCQSRVVDESGNEHGTYLHWTEDVDAEKWQSDFQEAGNTFIKQYLTEKNVIPNASAVLIRKSALKLPPGIENFRMAGDWIVWIETIRNNKVAYLSKPLNWFRSSAGNTRVHNTIEKYKRRLMEGNAVLDVLLSRGLIPIKRYRILKSDAYDRWYRRHGSMLGISFYFVGATWRLLIGAFYVFYFFKLVILRIFSAVSRRIK